MWGGDHFITLKRLSFMDINWTILEALTEPEYDTPALKKDRQDVNTEIEAIQQERQRITDALAVLQSTAVENLTIEQMTAARVAREDTFRLLQRELRLRNTLLKDYLRADVDAAGVGLNQISALIPGLEEKVVRDLEKIGFESFDAQSRSPGQWTPEFVSSHPTVVSANAKKNRLFNRATDYSPGHENNACRETVTQSLTSVRNHLTN